MKRNYKIKKSDLKYDQDEDSKYKRRDFKRKKSELRSRNTDTNSERSYV